MAPEFSFETGSRIGYRIATLFALTLGCVVADGALAGRRVEAHTGEEISGQAGVAAPLTPRELFKVFDIDESFWSNFEDDRPLDPAERERLWQVLFRLQRFPPAALAASARGADALERIAEDPDAGRGEVFTIEGRATRVVREEIDPGLRERLQIEAVYRFELVADDETNVVVYALAVPSEWKLDAPLDERCGARGVFVKRLAVPQGGGPPQNRPQYVFAAQRMAWYPKNLLGDAEMDFGLFDEVRDRTRLTERECFYQMLAAVRRIPEARIDAAGRDHLRILRKRLRALATDPALSGRQRTATRRALARAERDASDVVPLFNEPELQRGKLFVLRGEALRAIEVRVDDPDIVARFGIDHYYEVEIFTEDSQNHPIVCCVARLPHGMPQGDAIRENVTLSGFFLKSWAYGASPLRADAQAEPSTAARQQSAPLLIAATLEWAPAAGLPGVGWGATSAVVAAVFASVVALWFVARGDRRAIQLTHTARASLPERVELDTIRALSEDDASKGA